MLEPFLDLFKKKEDSKIMPERVKQADKFLPASIKNLSTSNLAKKINNFNKPSKWAITRFAASGKLDKRYVVGGNHYPPHQSENMRNKMLRKIEKGMIQVTPNKQ